MIEMRVDRYHSGARLAALGLWAAALAGVYLVAHWLAGLVFGPLTSFSVMVLVVVAFVAAQPVALLAEGWLVRRWPSGRTLRLEDGLVTLNEKSGSARIRLDQPLAYRRWRFEVRTRRGGHVPKGHHCLALRLAQNDQAVTAYAFLSPAALKDLTARFTFYELRRAKENGQPASALAGRDQTYLDAENDRWIFGAELDEADFTQLLAGLAPQVAGFADAPAG